MAKPVTLTPKERLAAIRKVAVMTYKTAPAAVYIQLLSSLFDSVLPLVTTYYAALTTTALAEAYAGNEEAGRQIIGYVSITVVLGAAMAAWGTSKNYIEQMLKYQIDSAITDHMYEHFLRLDFWQYDDKNTIDTYEKASEFARYFPHIFNRLASIVTSIFAFFSALVALLLVSWWLGLIIVAAVIPGMIIQFQLSRAQIKHWNSNVEVRRSIGMIEWHLLQPRNMAELRLYGMVRNLLDMRKKLRDKDEKVRIGFEKDYLGKRLMANAVEAAAEAGALIWTVLQIAGHALPVGHFIYVQQVVSRALNGATSFISTVNSIDEELANLVQYQIFSDMPEAPTGSRRLRGTMNVLSIEGMSFKYPQGDRQVIKNVSFEVKKGQHVAIVGENGAGKSTLVKIITGLYKPTKGAIKLDGVPLQEFDINTWHRQLAVLRQEYLEFGFVTAKRNVYFGDISRPFDQERFDMAIDMAEARGFLEKLPNGVDSFVWPWMEDDEGNKGTDLSGGQWQRLALARNFYRDSPVIILDEPTSAIDALAESRIFKHLLEAKDKTVITISHRLSTIKKADVIYMMQEGKLVEQGTYAELVKRKGAFHHMFESQL